DHRLDRGGERRADDLREHDRHARRGRCEEALDDLVLEVVDHRHAAPRRAEEAVHHDDRGREERDVRAGAEPAEPRDVLEELAVEDQPDHRLDDHHHDPDRLAHQVHRLAHDHEPGVTDDGHPPRSSVEKSRPVKCRYTSSSDGRDTETDATAMPSPSSAERIAGTARPPSSARATTVLPFSTCSGRAPTVASTACARSTWPFSSSTCTASPCSRAFSSVGVPSTATRPCDTIASRLASWSASSR